MIDAQDIQAFRTAVEAVLKEALSARTRYAPFNSAHEGYAVLDEERCELWDEVRRRDRDPENLRTEAIQVAAMAVRFMVECCPVQ